MRLPVCRTRYCRSQAHDHVEEHEHDEADAEDDEGASALVDDDLVDDHLGKERGGQPHQLDGEAGEENVLPDLFVLEQFGDKPGESEGLLFRGEAGDVFLLAGGSGGFFADQNKFRFEAAGGLFGADVLGFLGAGLKIKEAATIILEDDNGAGCDWLGFFCMILCGLVTLVGGLLFGLWFWSQKSDGRQRQLVPVKVDYGAGSGFESQ